MEEVGSRDADGVAGPCEEVLVSHRYIENFLRDMPQKDGNLRGRDEATLPGGAVAVDRGGVVLRRAQPVGATYDIQARLGGARPVRVRTASVGQGLSVVIVFLFSEAERREDSVAVVDGGDIVYAAPGDGGSINKIE